MTAVGRIARLTRDEDLRRRSLHALRHQLPVPRGAVFNLDVHVAVIADVAAQIERRGGSVTSWLLSGHSWTVGRDVDPVAIVNDRTWKDLDASMAARFRQIYGRYLRGFRGFVAAYPPAFALLYEGLDRPTLAVAATRYEWPFTHDAARWEWLDERLRAGVEAGWLTLAANNVADADYLESFSGLRPVVLPGACAYTAGEYTGEDASAVICTPDDDFAQAACARLTYPAIPLRAGLGRRYERRDLYRHRALVYIPYNVSIMSLFEHYAAGAPLYVPDRVFLTQLFREWPTAVLSSASFTQVTGVPAARRGSLDLNDLGDGAVLDWYLDRADFYDRELMPLIRQFGSWEELDELLRTDDHAEISREMLAANAHRFARIAERYDALDWLDRVVA